MVRLFVCAQHDVSKNGLTREGPCSWMEEYWCSWTGTGGECVGWNAIRGTPHRTYRGGEKLECLSARLGGPNPTKGLSPLVAVTAVQLMSVLSTEPQLLPAGKRQARGVWTCRTARESDCFNGQTISRNAALGTRQLHATYLAEQEVCTSPPR